MVIEIKMKIISIVSFSILTICVSYISFNVFIFILIFFAGPHVWYKHMAVAVIKMNIDRYHHQWSLNHWSDNWWIFFMIPAMLFILHSCMYAICVKISDIIYLRIPDYECSTGCIFQSHTVEELHSIAVRNISLGYLSFRSKAMPCSIIKFGLHLFE